MHTLDPSQDGMKVPSAYSTASPRPWTTFSATIPSMSTTGIVSRPAAPVEPLTPNVLAGSCRKTCESQDPIEQVLGGESYRVDTTQVEIRRAEKNNKPLWKSILQSGAMVIAIPVILPTAALYVVSMHVGPAWFRNRAIKTLVSAAMKAVGDLFDVERKQLLHRIGPNDVVLDLGAGSGCYLKYLCHGGRLVAIEPVKSFHEGYRKTAVEAGMDPSKLELHACDIETYLHNYPQQCVYNLLKPGGHVYFSEHVGMPKGTWTRYFQDLVNPIWRTAGGGCNCNRDSLASIRRIPGWQVISWQFCGFKVCFGPWVLGLAMKEAGD